MPRLLALALLALGLPAVAGPPAPRETTPESAKEAIEGVLRAQQTAWNEGNLERFLEGYWNSPELTFAGSEGIVRGYGGLFERYRKSYPDRQAMGTLRFSGLEVRPLGPDAALVVGRWHLTRTIGDAGGVFSLVFRRFPAGWRIIHDHTSIQKQTPPDRAP